MARSRAPRSRLVLLRRRVAAKRRADVEQNSKDAAILRRPSSCTVSDQVDRYRKFYILVILIERANVCALARYLERPEALRGQKLLSGNALINSFKRVGN